jgi:RNA recognition motif-containing protein
MVNIYVGNLPFSATEDEIRGLFEPHGRVDKVSIVMDRDTGRPRGFGFVEMGDDGEGRAAIEALNGKDFGGRSLTVNEAMPREARSSSGGGGFRSGGGGGGGFGGGGGGGGYRGGGGGGGGGFRAGGRDGGGRNDY